MYTQTMINPKTNRNNTFKCWNVSWDGIMEMIKAGKSAKEISFALLDDDESVMLMEETVDGDSQNNNFALNVFENALDWGIGITIINFMKSLLKLHKKASQFTVMANKKGDVFIACKGRIVF